MREFVTLTCERCGARIEAPPEAAKVVCEYCGTEYFSEEASDGKNAADGFTVVAGVLEAYGGVGKNVVLPDTVSAIGDAVFSGRELLESVTIPDTVTSIGDDAFQVAAHFAASGSRRKSKESGTGRSREVGSRKYGSAMRSSTSATRRLWNAVISVR